MYPFYPLCTFLWKIAKLYIFSFVHATVEGGSPCSKPYCRAKVKVPVFWNGQFSGHLVFYKKVFLVEKKTFSSLWTSTLFFWKKIIFPFLKQKCFFGKLFPKKFQKKFDNFFVGGKILEILIKNSSKKNFPKKHFFFKKRKIIFFKKTKLVHRVKKFFFSPKKLFL